MRVRLEVLGPIRAWRGDSELEVGSPQRRKMIALLLARSAQFVPVDDFIDLLWGSEPPGGAVNVVQQNIAGIRRLLEPGLAPRSAGRFLDRQGGAYRLRVDEASARTAAVSTWAASSAAQARSRS